jgi:uncharacterized protein YllA (UPF0747 family)
MLLQFALGLTAMAVNTLVVPSNITSTSATTQSLQKRTRVDNTEKVHMPRTDQAVGVKWNTYTEKEMAQFHQGHLDVLKLCKEVVAESDSETDLFKRLFPEYFDPKDRGTVIGEFTFYYKALVSTR